MSCPVDGGVEPPQGRTDTPAVDAVGHRTAGHFGGNHAVAGNVRGLVTAGEQRLVGHDQLHGHRGTRRCISPGHALEQQVRHHLITRSTLGTAGCDERVRVSAQRGVHAHRLVHRQQRRRVSHEIRSRTHAHAALRSRTRVPPHHGRGIELDRRGHRERDHLLVALPFQRRGVGAQPAIDLPPVRHGEVRRLPHQQHRAVLAQAAFAHRLQGVRHLVHQRPCESEVCATTPV